MRNDLDAFVFWLEQFTSRLPNDVSSKLVLGPQCDNRSAYIDIDAEDGRMGRLILHEYGGADADLFDASGNQVELSKSIKAVGGWDLIKPTKFDEALAPFTSFFLLLDQPNNAQTH